MGKSDHSQLVYDVRTLFSEAFLVPEDLISPDVAFGDFPEWDSLGHMNMLALLEERFGVEIDAETIAELISLPTICAYLERQNHD